MIMPASPRLAASPSDSHRSRSKEAAHKTPNLAKRSPRDSTVRRIALSRFEPKATVRVNQELRNQSVLILG